MNPIVHVMSALDPDEPIAPDAEVCTSAAPFQVAFYVHPPAVVHHVESVAVLGEWLCPACGEHSGGEMAEA